MKPLVIGVLALQGAFAKHIEKLRQLGVEAREVRKPEDLVACDALIVPGGESTTMMKQMDFIKFHEPFKKFAKCKPVFGTCAGIILISKEIEKDAMRPFKLLDITVERNAYGRQAESFLTHIDLNIESNKTRPFNAVFIRAPRIKSVEPAVKVLGSHHGEPVLVQQGFHLGATFHPELTADTAIHEYFIDLVQQSIDRAK